MTTGSRISPFQTLTIFTNWSCDDLIIHDCLLLYYTLHLCTYLVKFVGVRQWLWKLIVIFSSLISFNTSGGALIRGFRTFFHKLILPTRKGCSAQRQEEKSEGRLDPEKRSSSGNLLTTCRTYLGVTVCQTRLILAWKDSQQLKSSNMIRDNL